MVEAGLGHGWKGTQQTCRFMKATRIGNCAKVGLARADMLIAVVSVTLLTAVWLTTALSAVNLRRIMQAVHLYAGDNHGRLPHPSWGSVGSGGGPDNWAFADLAGAAGRRPERLPNPLWCDPLDPVNGGW